MTEELESQARPIVIEAPKKPVKKRLASWLPAIVLAGVFLAGFVPMWLKSNHLAADLFRAQRQARVAQIQTAFADAVFDARRRQYEQARQGMANFFTLVTSELDRRMNSALPAEVSAELRALLNQRDGLITLLARGDPASAERLANAYATFREKSNSRNTQ